MHKKLQFIAIAERIVQHWLNIQFFKLFVKRLLFHETKRPMPMIGSLILTLLTFETGECSFEELLYSGRAFALAGSVAGVNLGVESLFINPSGLLADSSGFEWLGSFYHPYEIAEINVGCFSTGYRRGKGAAAAGFTHLGNDLYHEHQICLGIARSFYHSIDMGAAIRYGTVAVQKYGQTRVILLDVGWRLHLSARCDAGGAIKNLTRTTIGRKREPAPQQMVVGFAIRARNDLQIFASLSKDVITELDVRCGIYYQPVKSLSFFCGAGEQPERFSLGFSIHILQFHFDYGFSQHIDLGTTHMAAIRFGRGD
ncbi:MAG: hypothetical protein EHM72_00665 [Calditrichaeota bacterium]|nr:MAG: hypothetical protein EHM72_00665 [Calditrichota bacterium]